MKKLKYYIFRHKIGKTNIKEHEYMMKNREFTKTLLADKSNLMLFDSSFLAEKMAIFLSKTDKNNAYHTMVDFL